MTPRLELFEHIRFQEICRAFDMKESEIRNPSVLDRYLEGEEFFGPVAEDHSVGQVKGEGGRMPEACDIDLDGQRPDNPERIVVLLPFDGGKGLRVEFLIDGLLAVFCWWFTPDVEEVVCE
ncbi:MAG: hypothetical protein M2R45_01804 [Verrucomicrobia subdivision 3 bacterium]|nr:hypothetical protein [Limisphaerales bacterium]MCS1415841.1 hypothetical protein [Limisphaerales bacterium]